MIRATLKLPDRHSHFRSFLSHLTMGLGVVLAQWCLLPSPAVAAGGHGQAEEQAEEAPPSNRPPTYDLGKFIIKNFRPIEHEQLTIKLVVHVEVAKEDQQQFEALRPKYHHRIRSQVITAIRLLPPQDLDDPELRMLRRLVYLRLRRVLPELPVSQVYVSEFGYLVE